MEPEWMGGNRKAILIPRVSTRKQDLEPQIQELKVYCSRVGLQVVEIFPIKESAKNSEDREEYGKAMAYAIANNIRHVIFFKDDREARNLTDVEKNERYVQADLISLHYVLDNKIIWKNSPDSDFFMRDMKAAYNKNFSRVLSVRTNHSQRVKAESGWFPGNKTTLGYVIQKTKDESGRELKRGAIIVPDPNEKNVRQVVREFEMRGYNRLTLSQIADQLVVEGFITSKQRPNYESTIDRHLKNKFYGGRFNWPSDGPEYQGKHELIIPTKLYKLVQEFDNRSAYQRRDGIFSGGWIRCASCGCFITPETKTKKLKSTGEKKVYNLYRCSNGRKVHQSFAGMYVKEDQLWEQLEGAIEAVVISEEFANDLIYALNESKHKTIEATKREIAAFREAELGLQGEEDRYLRHFDNGLIDRPAYDRHRARIRAKRDEYIEMMEQKNLEITDAGFETAKSTIELAKQAKELWLSRSPEERRDFLDSILSNPVLDGPTLRYDLRKPFALLSEMKGLEDWRPLRDSNSCLLRERELS